MFGLFVSITTNTVRKAGNTALHTEQMTKRDLFIVCLPCHDYKLCLRRDLAYLVHCGIPTGSDPCCILSKFGE